MTYVISWSDPAAKPNISLADRSYDNTSTSLILTGKGLQNYGLFQQENFVKLLEHFASATPPANPTVGQLWYDTANMWYWNWAGPVVGGSGGWVKASQQTALGLSDYSPSPDPSVVGWANRLNRVIGAPSGSTPTTWGWGQADLVPTFTSAGALDSASTAAQAYLPAGLTFPGHFDNNSWAIFISRLRRALRQTGLNETLTSPIGFVDDGLPSGTGNLLANYYNNHDAGAIPYQGTMADILSGFGRSGSLVVSTYYANTAAALSSLETYRFTLGASQTQLSTFANATRTSPGQSLYIPALVTAYVHNVSLTFADKSHADAFFNAGGQLQFNFSFTPSSGSPTNVELDWKNFLLAFQGMSFDYKGVKTSSSYLTSGFTPTYLPTIPGGSNYYGYFNLGSTPTKIFERDVLSTPGSGLYSSDPPTDGGVVINATAAAGTGNYVVTLNIEYYLQHVTAGTGGQNDTSSSALNGTMTSNVTGIFANGLNASITAPATAQSGTFITAA